MFSYDFTNHQNRFIHMEDMPPAYLSHIQKTTREDPFYPLWHIAPVCGLLNDPCGLFEQGGVHHLFHQWFPAGPVHGLKHWYGVTTRDFVTYCDRGIDLRPERACDGYGCYTGMALPTSDGAEIYYTGIEDDQYRPCVCQADYRDDRISNVRKIIDWDPETTTINFRDPCVFVREGKRWMVVGAENTAHQGCLLLYEQTGTGEFVSRGAVDLGGYPFGYMLECPNYFDTQDGGVLFFSPMGIESRDKYEFRNVFSVVYAKGAQLDPQNRTFRFDHFYEMDKGFDFYAPQTYRDHTGRQLLFGWLGNSKSPYPTDKNNWAHMLTLPREITWAGDVMVQKPVAELDALHANARAVTDGTLPLAQASFDLIAQAGSDFALEIANAAGECITFTGNTQEFCLDRGAMSHIYAERFGTVRYARRRKGAQTLRVMMDRSSLEIFADDGQTVFTTRVFIDQPVSLRTHGLDGVVYDMQPIRWERTQNGLR